MYFSEFIDRGNISEFKIEMNQQPEDFQALEYVNKKTKFAFDYEENVNSVNFED